MTVLSTRRVLGVVVGSNFNDPTNERLIFFSAAGLVVVGIALLVGTILWWRRGRQEHPALAPLEVLGSRSWTKAPEGERHRKLEKVRTAGGATPDEPERSEPLDLEALVRSSPQAFDDLREPGEVVEPAVGWAVEQQADAAEEPKAEALEVGAEPGVAVEPVEAAAVPAVVAPLANGVEHAEPEHAASNGSVVVAEVNDPDATSLTAERPAAEPAAAPGRTS
ncbi:MAG: hypothetical protein ACXV7I_14925 [Ilumatobacteraceae bacterium]